MSLTPARREPSPSACSSSSDSVEGLFWSFPWQARRACSDAAGWLSISVLSARVFRVPACPCPEALFLASVAGMGWAPLSRSPGRAGRR